MTETSLCALGDYQKLLVAEQATIRTAIVRVARRHRLRTEETEELTSEVFLKLVEDDYLILRKFEGRSSLQTYLTVVVHRVLLDRRIAEWGKWRPSATAKREGPVAVLFEQLTVCRGLSFDEACAALENAHGLTVDRKGLEALAGRLPARVRRRSVGLDEIEEVPSEYGDPASRCAAERQAAAAERWAALLARELEALSPEDRCLVRRRFFEGASFVSIARDTSREPKVLYRHLARLLKLLRRRLEMRGVTRLDVRELFVDAK